MRPNNQTHHVFTAVSGSETIKFASITLTGDGDYQILRRYAALRRTAEAGHTLSLTLRGALRVRFYTGVDFLKLPSDWFDAHNFIYTVPIYILDEACRGYEAKVDLAGIEFDGIGTHLVAEDHDNDDKLSSDYIHDTVYEALFPDEEE